MPSESEVLESRAGTVSSPEERLLEEEVKEELARACRDLKPPYGQIAYEFYCRQDRAGDRRAEGDQIKDSTDAGFKSEENASEKTGSKDGQTMKGGKCEKYY